jgi:hypothetical protein
VLQTEEGHPTGSNTSFAGYCVGNIVISTNGASTFRVSADGHVTVGTDERLAAGLPRTFPLDDVSGDGTPPLLTNVHATSIAATSATIAWTTNEVSSSIVHYGPTTAYGSTAAAGGLVTSHAVALSGLAPARLYHFRAVSTDGAGNTASSFDGTFRTGSSASYAPSATVILRGSPRAGTFARLATNNGSYYAVNSTTRGTRTSDWYGRATVPVPLAPGAALAVTYSGRNSKVVAQTLHLWDWSASDWVQIDSRNVGSARQVVSLQPYPAAAYVSATGEIRLRVLGLRSAGSFIAAGDFMRFSLESPGSSP